MPYSPPQPGQSIRSGLLTSLSGEWTPYTATLTSTTLGNGTLATRYIQSANRLIVAFILNWGSTTSGNMPAISVPVIPSSASGMRWTGNVIINRGSGRFRAGVAWLYSTSSAITTGAALSATPVEWDANLATAGVTMAAGGWIMGSIEYEVD